MGLEEDGEDKQFSIVFAPWSRWLLDAKSGKECIFHDFPQIQNVGLISKKYQDFLVEECTVCWGNQLSPVYTDQLLETVVEA